MDEADKLIRGVVAENRALRIEMFEAIATEETVSFVGAGLSAKLRYPDWNGLIRDLTVRANQLELFVAATDGALSIAEEIKTHFIAHGQENEYYSFLARTFDNCPARCSDTHVRLVRLPFRSFITTNYDPCLEHALCSYAFELNVRSQPDYGITISSGNENRVVISKLLRSLSAKFQKLERNVAHIHGRHSDPHSIVLTLADYEKAYGLSLRTRGGTAPGVFTIHRQLMWSLLATRRLIFIGCGMQDPYVTTLLKIVSEDLWEWETRNHFVILGLDKRNVYSIAEITQEFGRYGIAPIFFDNFDESYVQLDSLLDEARGFCKADDFMDQDSAQQGSPPVGHTAAPPSSPGVPSEEPTVTAPEWVDGLGERTFKGIVSNED